MSAWSKIQAVIKSFSKEKKLVKPETPTSVEIKETLPGEAVKRAGKPPPMPAED